MSSPTSSTQALCLLLVVIAVTIGVASATVTNNNNNNNNKIPNNKSQPTLPGSCLVAASTLCSNTETNAMRCVRKLAIKGDARVPNDCVKVLMAGVSVKPRRKQTSRTKRMSRLLSEGSCAANTCPSSFATADHNQCNDVQTGCGNCPHGTFTIPTTASYTTAKSWNTNPSNINCNNICCKAANGNGACCVSSSTFVGVWEQAIWCYADGHARCSLKA